MAMKSETLAAELEALLPELEYSRQTHIEWRDCPQHCRDRNPEIGSAAFHADAVKQYDVRIETIRRAANHLRHNK